MLPVKHTKAFTPNKHNNVEITFKNNNLQPNPNKSKEVRSWNPQKNQDHINDPINFQTKLLNSIRSNPHWAPTPWLGREGSIVPARWGGATNLAVVTVLARKRLGRQSKAKFKWLTLFECFKWIEKILEHLHNLDKWWQSSQCCKIWSFTLFFIF